jgi:hypothetical protein
MSCTLPLQIHPSLIHCSNWAKQLPRRLQLPTDVDRQSNLLHNWAFQSVSLQQN